METMMTAFALLKDYTQVSKRDNQKRKMTYFQRSRTPQRVPKEVD
jgi:hypothetical protein